MSDKSEEYKVYKHSEIEDHIQERHKEIQKEFIDMAHNLGEKNQPDSDHIWQSIQEAVQAKYDVLYANACKHIQGAAVKKLGAIDHEQGVRDGEDLNKQIKDKQEKTRVLGIDVERIKLTYHWGVYPFLLVLLALIFLSDAYYNQKAFAAMGDNFIVTILLSLGVGAGLWAISHYLVKFIDHVGVTLTQKRLIAGASFAFLAGVFLALGYLRTFYFNQQGDTFLVGSPFMFMLINLFLLGSSMLITYFALPNQHQRLEKKALDEKVKKLNQLNEELKALRQLREQMTQNGQANMTKKLLIVSYQEELLNHIQALCRDTIKSFEMENMLKRKDSFPKALTQ